MNGRARPEDGMKMIKFSKRVAFAALMVGNMLFGAIAPLSGNALAASDPVEVDRIVAVVNNEVITEREMNERIDLAVRQLQRQGTQLPPRDVIRKQILERLILERAQLQLASQNGIRADDATLDRAIERIASSNKLSVPAFREALERDGLSWDDFRNNIRREIVITRLREREVDSRIVVTDAEVDNFLDSNQGTPSEEYHLAHILLRAPEGATPEQFAALQARAAEVTRKLAAGEDFAKLAASYSDAPDALSGGDIGWRGTDRLPALYADEAGKLAVGEVSPVLRSPAGLHLVKLLEKRGGNDAADVRVEQTHARHILLKTSAVLSDADARQRLEALRERVLQGGEDFAELAKVHSADLSAAKGGDLGWVNPGDTVPAFERAMNALKPGEISEPVQTPFGWHIIQVLERRSQDVSEERKRTVARNTLRERKSDEAYDDWLRQLRDRTYVELQLDPQ